MDAMPRRNGDGDCDRRYMRRALALALRAQGETVPNPMVGAVLVREGRVLGEGWHRRAGQPHAEVEALNDAAGRGNDVKGATLYVTLEPCCTHGRTPPCTEAVIRAGIVRVVVAATDPNPAHAGRGFAVLRDAGIEVTHGILAERASAMNFGFNHWIVAGRPTVTLKAGMSLDGRIATCSGESRWITGERSRGEVMRLRAAHDAILVGIGTVLADDPSLTVRIGGGERAPVRVVLDSTARTPVGSKLVSDAFTARTIVVTTERAPVSRVESLAARVRVWKAPAREGRVDVGWVLRELGRMPVTSVLVEGGGEVHASFLEGGWVDRVRFFYGPLVIGGAGAPMAVGGAGFQTLEAAPRLAGIRYRRWGEDLMVSADVERGGRITGAD